MFNRFKIAAEALFKAGMNDTHSGNISIRDREQIIITSRQSITSNLSEIDLITVPLEGDNDITSIASRDLPVHRAIYKNTDSKAVIHAHPPFLTVLSLTENKILPQDVKGQQLFPQGLSVIKIRQGASMEEIEKMTVGMLGACPGAVVLKGYGCFVYANSIEEALELTSALEMSSKIWFSIKLLFQKQSLSESRTNQYDPRKRSAIPPSIGVMGRRTGRYGSRDMKR